ncbi:hypothetical protein NX059_003989 [Plenodomus lindquistii]|nr:hypothetical protein NX059_003989 [Plenodomus lindquistii]
MLMGHSLIENLQHLRDSSVNSSGPYTTRNTAVADAIEIMLGIAALYQERERSTRNIGALRSGNDGSTKRLGATSNTSPVKCLRMGRLIGNQQLRDYPRPSAVTRHRNIVNKHVQSVIRTAKVRFKDCENGQATHLRP